MICSKCNATIPDGSTSCPECHAKFERLIGSFAGSVHWEDEVRVNESEKRKKRTIILCSVLLVLIAAFWILHQTGVLGAIMEEVGWWYTRTFYPADRYANVIPMLFGRIGSTNQAARCARCGVRRAVFCVPKRRPGAGRAGFCSQDAE